MPDTNHKIIIITAPSGAGKTSITYHLMQIFPQLAFSVSAATRKPRGKEKDGIDYHFITEEDFKKKIQQNEFIESELTAAAPPTAANCSHGSGSIRCIQ